LKASAVDGAGTARVLSTYRRVGRRAIGAALARFCCRSIADGGYSNEYRKSKKLSHDRTSQKIQQGLEFYLANGLSVSNRNIPAASSVGSMDAR
jgi:hypothetical protein